MNTFTWAILLSREVERCVITVIAAACVQHAKIRTRDYKVCERHGYYTMDNNQFNQYNNNSGGNGNNNGGSGGNGNGNGRDLKKQNLLILLIATLLSLLCISYFMKAFTGATDTEISYNQFISMIEEGQVEKVKIESNQITIYPKSKQTVSLFYMQPTITYHTGKIEDDDTLTQRLLDANVEVSGSVLTAPVLFYLFYPYSANPADVGAFKPAASQDDRWWRSFQHG